MFNIKDILESINLDLLQKHSQSVGKNLNQ